MSKTCDEIDLNGSILFPVLDCGF